MEDEQAHVVYSDDQFDLDIRVKMTTREVDKFVIEDSHSCASTCGDECTNSCASTCAGSCPVLDARDETETCETCGSCTSECDRSLYEDHYVLEVSQVRADGVTRKVAGEHVIRRVVEHAPKEG
ncbi:hypothetical protein [Streptomyces avidinii]|uniref:MinD superfamily P-loop ATPase n=1 Tax=Streptomyces avidinii TaxID=1895 RepID=A0ABS4KXB3_STRAV|nr:hypothetical protein [Streptomyces avidinii]MBP2034675.1 MinD superfamily P-loop ATPase [Streptomyces avidinii]GGY87976.1 hypothetical protein GCM10010343_11390 [Streptomyces avidinii]